MPPKSQPARRQTSSQNEHVYALGKAGRRTGVTVPENDKRDEHGFEDMSQLFSSPVKETNGDAATSDGEDMEIDDGSEMGPATTRKLQRQGQGRPSIPRARSPIKTHLQSPARQNPHLVPGSSPVRGSIVTSRDRSPKQGVARKLNFSMSQNLTNGHSKANATKKSNGKLPNGHAPSDDSEEEASLHGESELPELEDVEDDDEEPLDMLDAAGEDGGAVEDDEPEQQQEEDEDQDVSPIVQHAKEPKRRGRKPKAAAPVEDAEQEEVSIVEDVSAPAEDTQEEPVKKRRGRPKASPKQEVEEPSPPKEPTPPAKTSKKRGRPARTSIDNAEVDENNPESRETKRPRPEEKADKNTLSKPTATKEKGKPGRKRKSSGIGVDSPVVRQGPPLPRGPGLVTMRREGPGDMRTTRSGRASFKPLEFWKNEHVLYDDEEVYEDKGGRVFKMAAVKGVVRAEPVYERKPKRRGRPKAKAGRRSRSSIIPEEEVEREEWEEDPGRIGGECIMWQPGYENEPPQDEDQVDVVEEELAISKYAIQLKDIKDATFKFAKTLTLPFFGAGIVDLPPGAEKRPKNSRKMQMVFFVHTGCVEVTVAQTTFKIAEGGQWFVPRGNHYSIANLSDKPARVFFSQGCELTPQMQQS
ncbi:Uu.00g066980.m01.CDS01 [Anthostomella pinea]|uniref:CENP-C homolog n=1 Tax=Anthostomella pinea TaxID=933095 RepID=A0AAI8YNB0_9PEZI|nr:Uu.00g066980.m01.CDS01 [Anthostomella pinea]